MKYEPETFRSLFGGSWNIYDQQEAKRISDAMNYIDANSERLFSLNELSMKVIGVEYTHAFNSYVVEFLEKHNVISCTYDHRADTWEEPRRWRINEQAEWIGTPL